MNSDISNQVYDKLTKNTKGNVDNNHKNILLVFEEDKNLQNIFRTNEFTQMKEVNRHPFWRRKNDLHKLWSDIDEAQLLVYLGEKYELVNKRQIMEVLDSIFYQNSYNPIIDYLNSLKWDGKSRLETLFIDYLGASDNIYTREVTKTAFTACVMRVFEPGSKYDTVPVLVGEQGIGKSYLLAKMGMNWFNESIQSFQGDEAYIKISTSWIIELSELTALKRGDSESIKAFISAKEDTYRPKYGRYPIQSPRKCVFFGTTNNVEFLRDDTGNRRWLPIQLMEKQKNKCPFNELVQKEVDQIWAEAKFNYDNGGKTILTNQESIEIALNLQEQHREDNGLKGRIESFLNLEITKDWYSLSNLEKQRYFAEKQYQNESLLLEKRQKICSWEIWYECLMNKNTMTKKQAAEINHILRQIKGLRETRTTFGSHGQQRGFLIKIN